MKIAYAAYTGVSTYLLDEAGVCRRVVLRSDARAQRDLAARCIGAQYVASLDPEAADLVDEPRPGVTMLFAAIDGGGRVSLLRTGTLFAFLAESKGTADAQEPDASADEPTLEIRREASTRPRASWPRVLTIRSASR